MDFEQGGKLILGVVFLILLIALVIVRRGMKPEPPEATRLAGASLHTLQDIHASLREIAGYLKADIQAQRDQAVAKFVAAHTAGKEQANRQRLEREQPAKNTRKVRAGTGRS